MELHVILCLVRCTRMTDTCILKRHEMSQRGSLNFTSVKILAMSNFSQIFVKTISFTDIIHLGRMQIPGARPETLLNLTEFTYAFCVTSNTPRKSLVFSLFDIFVFWTHRRSNDIYAFKFSPEERNCLFFLNLSRRTTAKYVKTRGNRAQKNMTNVS